MRHRRVRLLRKHPYVLADGHADYHADSRTHGGSDGHADGHADCHADLRTDGRSDGHADGHADLHADTRTDDGHAERLADIHADNRADIRPNGRTDERANGDADFHADRSTDGHANSPAINSRVYNCVCLTGGRMRRSRRHLLHW